MVCTINTGGGKRTEREAVEGRHLRKLPVSFGVGWCMSEIEWVLASFKKSPELFVMVII